MKVCALVSRCLPHCKRHSGHLRKLSVKKRSLCRRIIMKDCSTFFVTYYMEQSLAWEADRFLDSKQILRIFWNSKVHYLKVLATCPYPEPDKSSPYPSPCDFLKIYCNIILPSTPRSSKWFLSNRFPHQISVCTSPLPIPDTCIAISFFFSLVTRIIFGEEYISLRSSLCGFMHSRVTVFVADLANFFFFLNVNPFPQLNLPVFNDR